MNQVFSERIKIVIGNQTNVDFAKKCKISETNVRALKKRDTPPTWSTIQKIAQATGVRVHWLSTGEGAMYAKESSSNVVATLQPGEADRKEKLRRQTETAKDRAKGNRQTTELIDLTIKVLESDTLYSSALAENIKAFAQAVDDRTELATMRDDVETLKKQVEGLIRSQGQQGKATA